MKFSRSTPWNGIVVVGRPIWVQRRSAPHTRRTAVFGELILSVPYNLFHALCMLARYTQTWSDLQSGRREKRNERKKKKENPHRFEKVEPFSRLISGGWRSQNTVADAAFTLGACLLDECTSSEWSQSIGELLSIDRAALLSTLICYHYYERTRYRKLRRMLDRYVRRLISVV
jgi:hypothetical protein